MSSDFKTNCNVVYSCKYHVVWCPKYRRKVLVNGVDTRLKEILHQTAQEFRATVIELEVMPDHVHLLCEVDPQFGAAFPPADGVDQFVFRCHSGRRSPGGHQAVHRKPEGRLRWAIEPRPRSA